ncbi:MAG: DNA replication/repair protein RecF [Sphingomonadaceae bacterium]|nr:DNA replication/repair protein RecF [Sphingomonadaceae bacterium]
MHVAALRLTDFRNHADSGFAPGVGLNALTGDNGAGKTNILEGLSLLSLGRGLRAVPYADMIRDGATGGFAVAATLGDSISSDFARIGTGNSADAPARRQVRINGADAALTNLGEYLSLLWLTPAMDRLFVDAASQRRRFVDRMVLALEPAQARHATRYDAAMRQRARLLAGERIGDGAWLGALEAQMAEHGALLDAARHRLLRALADSLAAEPDGPFARPHLALINSDGDAAPQWDAGAIAAALAGARGRDAAAGRALTGPHRFDLAAFHAGHGQAAARCSTGEQKAMLLSIVLAHGDVIASLRGQRPILLLDELAAHLDPARRAALFERLAATGGQVWMTGTEGGLFHDAPSHLQHWHVAGGTIIPA